MNVLVCNVGSTSLKFKLYDMPACTVTAQGAVERVGSDHDATFAYKNNGTGQGVALEKQDIPDYQTGIERFLQELTAGKNAALAKVEDIERIPSSPRCPKGILACMRSTTRCLTGCANGCPWPRCTTPPT